MKVLDSGLGVACWLTLVMVSTGSSTFGEESTGLGVDTAPLRKIEQRCLPLELVPGSARCDSLPAYYWAANRELHYSFQRAQKIWEAGCPWPYRAVTLVAGSAGVGKTFIKGEVFHETCPATAVCELDIRDLYAEWEEQGLVEPRPDLFDGDVVLSRLPALVDRGKRRVAQFHKKFNEQLADNKFVAGDRFTVADITTITVVDFGHAMEMPIPDSAPHVKRWYDEMQKRDSVQKSKPTHLPDGSPMPEAAE